MFGWSAWILVTALSHLEPARADCPSGPKTTADVVAELDDAESAYGGLKVDAFRAAMAEVRAAVPCLSEEVTSHVAAEIHRYEGLLAFLDRVPERSMAAFAAARAIEPNYKFPETVVPANNPALADYLAIDPDASPRMRVAQPIDARILFDGQPAVDRARDFPAIVQLVSADGSVRTTAYVWPGDPLPAYAPRPDTDIVDRTGGGGGPSALGAVRSGPHVGLLGSAGVGAVLAGALYTSAFVVHRKYYGDETPLQSLDGLRTANNSLVVASGATLGVAVGLGTTAFLVGRF